MNFLKQARDLRSFRENPVKARGPVELFDWISAQVWEFSQPVAPPVGWGRNRWRDRSGGWRWGVKPPAGFETMPEYPLE